MASGSQRLSRLDGSRGDAALFLARAHGVAARMPIPFFGAEGRPAPLWQVDFAGSMAVDVKKIEGEA